MIFIDGRSRSGLLTANVLTPLTLAWVFEAVIVGSDHRVFAAEVYHHNAFEFHQRLHEQVASGAKDQNFLMNSLNLTGFNWIPMGSEKKPFRGSLDGMGHVIYGLELESHSNNINIGLFGYTAGGTFTRLRFENPRVNLTGKGGYAAVLSGQSRDTELMDLQVHNGQAESTAPGYSLGFLAATGDKVNAKRVAVQGAITVHGGSQCVAAFIGFAFHTSVQKSLASVEMTGYQSAGFTGGACGVCFVNSINGCLIDVAIKTEKKEIHAGAVGGVASSPTAREILALADINTLGQSAYAGGLFGYVPSNAFVTGNAFFGNVSAEGDDALAACLVGGVEDNSGLTVKNNICQGEVHSKQAAAAKTISAVDQSSLKKVASKFSSNIADVSVTGASVLAAPGTLEEDSFVALRMDNQTLLPVPPWRNGDDDQLPVYGSTLLAQAWSEAFVHNINSRYNVNNHTKVRLDASAFANPSDFQNHTLFNSDAWQTAPGRRSSLKIHPMNPMYSVIDHSPGEYADTVVNIPSLVQSEARQFVVTSDGALHQIVRQNGQDYWQCDNCNRTLNFEGNTDDFSVLSPEGVQIDALVPDDDELWVAFTLPAMEHINRLNPYHGLARFSPAPEELSIAYIGQSLIQLDEPVVALLLDDLQLYRISEREVVRYNTPETDLSNMELLTSLAEQDAIRSAQLVGNDANQQLHLLIEVNQQLILKNLTVMNDGSLETVNGFPELSTQKRTGLVVDNQGILFWYLDYCDQLTAYRLDDESRWVQELFEQPEGFTLINIHYTDGDLWGMGKGEAGPVRRVLTKKNDCGDYLASFTCKHPTATYAGANSASTYASSLLPTASPSGSPTDNEEGGHDLLNQAFVVGLSVTIPIVVMGALGAIVGVGCSNRVICVRR